MRWQVVSLCFFALIGLLARAEPPDDSFKLAVKQLEALTIEPNAILDSVGRRGDKNSVGHGRNVALYTGSPSKFFFATHELGDVFSAVDGKTVRWWPDEVVVAPPESKTIIETRTGVRDSR